MLIPNFITQLRAEIDLPDFSAFGMMGHN